MTTTEKPKSPPSATSFLAQMEAETKLARKIHHDIEQADPAVAVVVVRRILQSLLDEIDGGVEKTQDA